jgi:hypothetical protein
MREMAAMRRVSAVGAVFFFVIQKCSHVDGHGGSAKLIA